MFSTESALNERPVFVVSPPQSGAALLADTLARSPDLWLAAEGIVPADLANSAAEVEPTDRLAAADATDEAAARVREALADQLHKEPSGAARPIIESGRNALRVAFLASVFPEATFVYVHREPRAALPSMVEAWERADFGVTHADLPGWPGPPWSLTLIPGWRDLAGMELAQIAAAQWTRTTQILLDDLEALPGDRWAVVDIAAAIARPEREVQRLAEFLGIGWTERLPVPLPVDGQLLELAHERKRKHVQNISAMLPMTRAQADRAREWVARPRRARAVDPSRHSPLRSVYTGSFPDLLRQLGSSLLVSTYQSGKLICVRNDNGRLNTHFRNFQRPMGLAVRPNRIVLGTRSEVLDLRNMPEAAAKIEPEGSHDACFLPRKRHFTGEIRIHDVAFTRDRVWLVATDFSCLATLDGDHNFVPRWAPPWISAITPGDRCHLNGLCVVDDEPRYVTALAESDQPGGWRPHKASGGMLIDVPSGEPVLRGLSMPHSPRWHDGRLWLLESGRGTLAVADLDAGTWETVAELPGFTRGLSFAGPYAFVGLSQIRETVTFGGLPLTERLEERLSGVWVVDTRSGSVAAFLRFEDLVQEVFEVAIMAGQRFPDIAEDGSEMALHSYALPHGSAVPRYQPAGAPS